MKSVVAKAADSTEKITRFMVCWSSTVRRQRFAGKCRCGGLKTEDVSGRHHKKGRGKTVRVHSFEGVIDRVPTVGIWKGG
jgi:hypothetical protein